MKTLTRKEKKRLGKLLIICRALEPLSSKDSQAFSFVDDSGKKRSALDMTMLGSGHRLAEVYNWLKGEK